MNPKRQRRNVALHLFLCTSAPAISAWIAYLLRFDFQVPSYWMPGAVFTCSVCVATQVPILWMLGWRRVGWYGIALPDLRLLVQATAAAVTVSSAVILLTPGTAVPRSIVVVQAAALLAISVTMRLAIRVWRERQAPHTTHRDGKRVFIYGAGFAGQALLRALHLYPDLGYRAVGFVDDSDELQREIVQALPVVSNGAGLCQAVVQHVVDEVLIAIPTATPETLQRIRTYCDQAGRPCKTVPGLAELLQRPEGLTELRQLEMEGLLGRRQVALDQQTIRQRLAGKVVLVTGAAGSIGSELCRQLTHVRPRRIVALDIAETPLFHLEHEFAEKYPSAPLLPVIGDIRDEQRLHALLTAEAVEVVFHAAAYKHVPLMEQHVAMAVENNVLGTYSLANAAERAGVCQVVMISTDKAVRPSSVMGATKRIAEMVVQSRSDCATGFVSVRFGNVLGSNGSVIPIFRRQISKGGPVTVTHPEMRRYFMTIPEASRLVLEASTMGSQNEIFVLDMGSPVRIDDLARNLIALHGLRAGHDIEVQYTGLRPGEKMFEELYLSDENLVRTVHEKILVLQGPAMARERIDACVARLRACLRDDPESLLAVMREMVPDFQHSGGSPTVSPTRNAASASSSPIPRKLIAGNDSVNAFEPA